MTSKAGIDLTPYFNVEGFVRHLYRNAQTDPQDPFFLNNGLVVDAPGYNTKTEETLARVEGTLKLFDDRWIQSAKWTGSRTGVTGIENFAQASASLGTAQTLTYKSSVLLDSDVAGGEKHRITGLLENRREQFSFDSIFLFGPDLDAARNGYTRSHQQRRRRIRARLAARPAPRYRSRSGRTSTSRSRTNTLGAIRSRRSSA